MRGRLVAGIATCIIDKGLAATTIADIARAASTSKRTFYEHFTDKDDCFLALYRARSTELMAQIESVIEPGSGLGAGHQLRRVAEAFVDFLLQDRALARAHLIEVAALGERGVRARREVVDGHAASLCRLVGELREAGVAIRPVEELGAVCIIGGLNEIALRTLDVTSPAAKSVLIEGAATFLGELAEAA